MATVDKTWVFAADTEGLVDVGDSAVLGSSWSAADGNPAGSIEWQQFSGGTTTERARRAGTGQTWETWGVPAGATVNSVQVVSWDYLVWSASGMSAERLRFRIVGSGGTTVHSAGELVDDTTIHAADGGTPHAGAAGTSRAVDGGSSGSTTDVRFEIELGCTASGTPNIDYEQDNILLRITYTAAAAGGSATIMRPVLFKLQAFRLGNSPGGLAFPPPSGGVGGPTVFPQTITANATVTATIVRQVGKGMTANATSTASIVKSVGKRITANATVTATLAALKAALLTMTATVTSTASIVKSVGKPMSATVTSTASMVRQIGKTLAPTVTTTATMVRQVGKKITANATVTASLSAIKAVLLTMTATVTSTATIRRQVGKGMTATATSTATIRRSVGHGMSATVTSTAAISRQIAKTLTATVTSVATIVAQFISGAAQTIYTRFFGRPSPDEAELGGSPDANRFGGSPDSDDFGPGSPGSGGFGPPGPGRS